MYSDKERWGDLEVVTDRLNSPSLINHYEKRFSYQYHTNCPGNVQQIFTFGKGLVEKIIF